MCVLVCFVGGYVSGTERKKKEETLSCVTVTCWKKNFSFIFILPYLTTLMKTTNGDVDQNT
jgi:hypothetical protein